MSPTMAPDVSVDRRVSRVAAVGLVLLLSGCAGSQSSAAGQDPAASPAAGGPTPGRAVMGEPLTTRAVFDPQQDNMPVGVMAVPEKWIFESKVIWNYDHYSSPVILSVSARNPANDEAFFSYPLLQFFDLRPGGYFKPGQNYGGLVYAHAQPPVTVLAAFIRNLRTDVANLRFVGSKDLPELPAALKAQLAKDQHGLGVKVAYDLNGRPIEEEFYAVAYSVDIPYDGPQGRTWQTNWGLSVHSFRGAAGTLDRRRPVFSAIAKSFRPNPAWQRRLAATNTYLADQFNRQLQAGYDSIAAAARLSRQISANNDAMIAAIDRQLQTPTPSAGASSSRTSADTFDDYIRGVETTDDPYYGTSQHAITEQFHWTDGYGNYRNSNDTTYDPNRTEVGAWQMMAPAK